MIDSCTVGGRLVAVPWHSNAGLLYFRADLLEKHGIAGPPATWEELEISAARVQEAERAGGAADFHGWLWQGAAQETLTCNALEWQVSQGGGRLVDSSGKVTVDNPKAAAALARAAEWIGTITPKEVLEQAEPETLAGFRSGNGLFLRHWPYAWADLNAPGSPVAGKVGIAPLPAGDGGRASTLGGWHLAVSRYSEHPEQAAELVKWMTSRRAQLQRAVDGNLLPTRRSVFDRHELAAAFPQVEELRSILEEATARPSAAAGITYSEVSAAYYTSIHAVLAGKATPEEAVAVIEDEIQNALRGR
jgi:trehalose/maltose transport system substrate-binding protein